MDLDDPKTYGSGSATLVPHKTPPVKTKRNVDTVELGANRPLLNFVVVFPKGR
jgi:hypothetical protein